MTILRPSHLAAPLPLLLAGALLLAACAGVTPGPAATLSPAPPPGLRPGQALTRALPAGGSDELRLALPAAAYVRIQVDQTEVDVAVRLLDPQGRTVATADGPGGRQAPEVLALITAAAGEYCLWVAPHAARAPGGRYTAELQEMRPATPADRSRVAADLAFNAAKHLRALGEPRANEAALGKLQEAIAGWRQAGDAAGQAAALNERGAVERRLNRTGEALASYQEALSLALAAGDRRHAAEALNNLGVIHNTLGGRAALELYEQALDLWQGLGDRGEAGNTLYNLGVFYSDRGESDRARGAYEQALALARQAGNETIEALTLASLGGLYGDGGQTDRALDAFACALAVARAAGLGEAEADALRRSASIYLRQGELQRALQRFSESLDRYHRMGDSAHEASVLSNLVSVDLYLGNTDRALAHSQQALALHQGAHDAGGEAVDLMGIGWIHVLRQEPAPALERFRAALAIYQARQEPTWQAFALYGMGAALRAAGDLPGAIPRLEESLRLRGGAAAGSAAVAQTLVELGEAYRAAGDLQRAGDALSRALVLARGLGNFIVEVAAQGGMARLERDRGHLEAAVAAAEAARRILDSVRTKVASQGLRASFLASRRQYYELPIDLLMQRHERAPGEGFDAAALAAGERARARVLLDLLAEDRIDLRRGIAADLKQRERDLEGRTSWLQGQLLDGLSAGQLAPEKVAWIEGELRRAQDDREALEAAIRTAHPRYAEVRYPSPLGLAAIQGTLDARTALLEYAVGSARSFLFVVTREGLHAFVLPPADHLAGLVGGINAALQHPGRRTFRVYVDTARRLYREIVAPAADVLAGKPRLIVSPEGPLLSLSFEALLTADVAEGPDGDYSRLPYLIGEKSLAYVPSASVLAELRRSRARRAEGDQDPQFVGFAWSPPAPVPPPDPAGGGRRGLGETGLDDLEPLPEVQREVSAIAGLYPPARTAVYLGGEATEENVKENARVKTARRLHFAAHGLLNAEQPELSGLVLARRSGGREDGLLQVYEIFNLELDADLVVLSACRSGLGREVAGEGLIGISRAFLYAGAASVLVSLWQVTDASTADLMVRFYRHLDRLDRLGQGGDKAEALRLAKLELIRGGTYAQPYEWAPFILIGDPD